MTWLARIHLLGISVLCAILSGAVVRFLGRGLGWIWYYALPIRRQVVLDNLDIVFQRPKKELKKIAAEAIVRISINTLELFKLRFSAPGLLSGIGLRGDEHYERAVAKGKGVVIVTGHLGNFDLLACSFASRQVPSAIVSKRLHNSAVNEFWMATRRKTGLCVFEEGKSQKNVLKWLRAGKVLGIVVDQRTSKKNGGCLIPFFKRKVWTSCAAARLAISTGATILPVMIHRVPNGTHEIIFEPPVQLNRPFEKGDEFWIMEQIHHYLERWIEMYPEEWMWLHRRFKHSVHLRDQS